MRVYETKMIPKRQLHQYCCDKCKKIIPVEDIFEIQETCTISFVGGYTSVFGDGNSVNADLCQQCLKELIGDFCTRSENLPIPEDERRVHPKGHMVVY